MTNQYEGMTDVDFDGILQELTADMDAIELLNIPGVYEAIAEHFNNDVLDEWDRRHKED